MMEIAACFCEYLKVVVNLNSLDFHSFQVLCFYWSTEFMYTAPIVIKAKKRVL